MIQYLSRSILLACCILQSVSAVEHEAMRVQEPPTPAEIYGETVRSTESRTPLEELAGFHVPEGFEVQLVASEPAISKPMNLAFDSKNQLWISQSTEYPYPYRKENDPQGVGPKDKIVVLRDEDNDGYREKAITFADGLNVPIGLLPYRSGVFCFSIPNILFIDDTDGDGVGDKSEIVLGPFDTTRDTHGMVNSMRFGRDGWIYACHGFNNQSTIQGKDGHSITLISGNVFRFRPDGSRVELYTQGQVNPFGMATDSWGDRFTADCHSKPISQLVQGGCYPSFGRPDDGLGFIAATMEHLHGSTAIAGLAISRASAFSESQYENFYSGNVMTCRINRNRLVRIGDTVRAEELPDFLTSDDPWFRPVDLAFGPDGSLYVADFYNKVIGHYEVPLDHPGRDRHRGRIWRLVPKSHSSSGTHDTLAKGEAQVEQMWDAAANGNRMSDESFRSIDGLHNGAYQQLFQIATAYPSFFSAAQATQLQRSGMNLLLNLGESKLIEVSAQMSHDRQLCPKKAIIEYLSQSVDLECIDALVIALQRNGNRDPILESALKIAIRSVLNRSEIGPRYLEKVAEQLGTPENGEKRSPALAAKIQSLLPILISLNSDSIPFTLIANFLNNELDGGITGTGKPNLELFNRWLPRLASVASEGDLQTVISLAKKSSTFTSDKDAQLRIAVDTAELIAASYTKRFGKLPPSATAYIDDVLSQYWEAITQKASIQSLWKVVTWREVAYREADESWPLNEWLNIKTWQSETRKAAVGDRLIEEMLISSFPLGESYRGVLRSNELISASQIAFDVAGQDGLPAEPSDRKNRVELIDLVTNKVLKRYDSPRSDIAQRVVWDVTPYKAMRLAIQVVDDNNRSTYAWLAAGHAQWTQAVTKDVDVASELRGVLDEALVEKVKSLAAAVGASRSSNDIASDRSRGKSPWLAVRDDIHWKLDWERSSGQYLQSPLWALSDIAASLGLTIQAQDIHSKIDGVAGDEIVRKAMSSIADVCDGRMQAAFVLQLAKSRHGVALLGDAIDRGQLPRESLSNLPETFWLANDATKGIERLNALRPDVSETQKQIASDVEAKSRRVKLLASDATAGAELFKQNCALCHQLAGKGNVLGPQLEGVGGRGLPRLCEDILLPHRNVDEAFRISSFILDGGEVVSGLIKSKTDNSLTIVDGKGVEKTIPLQDIEESKHTTLSLMPDGFRETFTDQMLADLIGYLQKPK